jgi:hypothetical protein
MKNIEIKKEKTLLHITIDLSKTFGPSKSGKTTIVASTEGNIDVGDGVKIGINAYK